MTSFNLTSSGAAIVKAGAYAPSITQSGALMNTWCDEAEATLSVITRRDWVTDYATLKANTKQILSDTVSKMIAKNIILYDSTGYNSLADVTTILDVYTDDINRNIEVLRDQKYQEKM